MLGGGPTNTKDRAIFADLSPAEQVRIAERAEALYDGSRTVAACWKQALSEREGGKVMERESYRFPSDIGHGVTLVVEGPIDAPGSLYHLKCDACGPWDVAQEYMRDAEVIAERHAEVGPRRP